MDSSPTCRQRALKGGDEEGGGGTNEGREVDTLLSPVASCIHYCLLPSCISATTTSCVCNNIFFNMYIYSYSIPPYSINSSPYFQQPKCFALLLFSLLLVLSCTSLYIYSHLGLFSRVCSSCILALFSSFSSP